jgi:hypothetical protein
VSITEADVSVQSLRCGKLQVMVMMAAMAAGAAWGQDAPDTQGPPVTKPAPIERRTPAEDSAQEQTPAAPQTVMPPMAPYDKAIFLKTIAPADLQFLKQFEGAGSGNLWSDKQFKHFVRSEIPGVMYHYGNDRALNEAMDNAISGSNAPVKIRDGRYVIVTGRASIFPGLRGEGFMWVDMQEGLVLGAFVFWPSNGEPSPAMTVWSKQIKVSTISLGQLPPAFSADLADWQMSWGVPMVTTRYFIGDANMKILLEHDEDFCAPANGQYGPQGTDCEQLDADAADADMTAAYFLDETNYKTNATAYMLGPDQVEFLHVRDRTCGGVLDPLGCRMRMTRERTRVILRRRPHV